MNFRAAFYLSFALMLPQPSLGLTVEHYKAAKGDEFKEKVNLLYIKGLGDAFLTANVAATKDFGQSLYCPPDNLALNRENYRDLIDQELDRLKPNGDMRLSLLLLNALSRTFPCQ